MGLCISKNADCEPDIENKYKTNNTETKENTSLSTKRDKINMEASCDLSDNNAPTVQRVLSSTDTNSQLLSNFDENSQNYCQGSQVTEQNISDNAVPLLLNNTTPIKQTMDFDTTHNEEASLESYPLQTRAENAREENLKEIEKTHNTDNGETLYKDGKEEWIPQKVGIPTCDGPGKEKHVTMQTHNRCIVEAVSRKPIKNCQIQPEITNSVIIENIGEQETSKQKHVSLVQERVKELEKKLLSTKNATINNQTVDRISNNSVFNVSEEREARIHNLPNLNLSTDQHSISESKCNTREQNVTTENKMKTSTGKNRRLGRHRDSLVRASTVFSSETLSNLVAMCSREKVEAENANETFEKEPDEKSLEDSLIAKLKRNDSSPGIDDLSSEVALKRWKYKNRQRKLRESRILWDSEEAIRGIRGSVLKAHTSMKIFM